MKATHANAFARVVSALAALCGLLLWAGWFFDVAELRRRIANRSTLFQW